MTKRRDRRYEIIYEDVDLLVVDKVAGLLTLPDRYDQSLVSLYQLLRHRYGTIYPVHRLDKWTSGLLLFAKNAQMHRKLNALFLENTIKKTYLAIIFGHIKAEGITVKKAIRTKPGKRHIMEVHPDGKLAITHIRSLENYDRYSLVEVQISTGRQHQIRVHLQHIGHPLMVDSKYSPEKAFYLSSIKKKYRISKNDTERPLLARTALHAHLLQFVHPTTRESLEYRSSLPKDLSAVLYQLRKSCR